MSSSEEQLLAKYKDVIIDEKNGDEILKLMEKTESLALYELLLEKCDSQYLKCKYLIDVSLKFTNKQYKGEDLFSIMTRFFGKSKITTLTTIKFLSSWDFEDIENGDKHFDALLKMVREGFEKYPDDCEHVLELASYLFECPLFSEKCKDLAKEFLEISFKCLVESLKKDNEKNGSLVRGFIQFLMEFGDQDVILKTILPLQSNFFKEDINVKEASISMFTSLVTLKLKSVLTFITKSYPLFLKSILNPKENIRIRIACLVSISYININYPQVFKDNRDDMVDLLQQLIKDDSSDNEYIILHILNMIYDIQQNPDLKPIPNKDIEKYIPILLEKYLKIENSILDEEVTSIMVEHILNLEDRKYYFDILEKLAKVYEKGVPKSKHLLVTMFLEKYFDEYDDNDVENSEFGTEEFQTFNNLFKDCYTSDNQKVLRFLAPITHLSKDKDEYFAILSKKVFKGIEDDNFDAFDSLLTAGPNYNNFIANNFKLFWDFFTDFYDQLETGKIPFYQHLDQVYEAFGFFCQFISDNKTISFIYKIATDTISDLINQAESGKIQNSYEIKYIGIITLVTTFLINYGPSYDILDFSPLFPLCLKLIQVSQSFGFVNDDEMLLKQMDIIRELDSAFGLNNNVDHIYLVTIRNIITLGKASEDKEVSDYANTLYQTDKIFQ